MIGILLLNTGTPVKPDRRHVAKYLREFLMDPRVIDLPFWIRWPLVNLVIVPTRARFSSHAYQQIWTEAGSPLLVHSQNLKTKLAEKLGENYCVELGMRYGSSSIASGLEKLKHCAKIILVPMYPQYASASSGSVLEESLNIISCWKNIPALSISPAFYNEPGFTQIYVQVIKNSLDEKSPDFLLFSYHGLPERQDAQINPSYSLQCYATSQALAGELKLSSEQYATTFQSRLGKTPWIKPYTDDYLSILINRGVKNLWVACPSFVADCLETLEEVGIRLKAQWLGLGGKDFQLLPCLNSEQVWVDWLVKQFLQCHI